MICNTNKNKEKKCDRVKDQLIPSKTFKLSNSECIMIDDKIHQLHNETKSKSSIHVTRMEDVHMPKAVFLCELQERKRDRGAPRKHHKDQLKRQHDGGISHQSWQQEASDRDSRCLSVRKASCKFEAYRHEAAKEECWRQKEQAASQSSSTQTFVCPKCSRVCTSRVGLCSHQ